MKILFLTHRVDGTDGWSRYARDLICSIEKRGVEVRTLVHQVASEIQTQQIGCLGEPLQYVANPFKSRTLAKQIQSIVDEYKPDIIHIIVETYATALPFLNVKNAKVVLTVHSTYAFLPILVSGLRRLVANHYVSKVFSRIDHVIAVSEYTKKHLLRHMQTLGVSDRIAHKISVTAGGVDLGLFANSSVSEKHTNRPIKNILFVGAIKPRKGLKEALSALALVKSDFRFNIVGAFKESDLYVQELKTSIQKNNLGDRVIFRGRVSDDELRVYYEQADLFLMLSTNNGADFEGYGLVYIEANAYGVPCIGPRDSGVAEAIVDGQTGYLVDQYDPQSVASRIEDIIVRNTITSVECRKWAEANSTEHKADSIFELYRKLIS